LLELDMADREVMEVINQPALGMAAEEVAP
jgi:hypothetical protein